MKKKRLIMIVLQMLLVAGFSYSFYTYVQKEVEPTNVYVYSQDSKVKDEVKVTVSKVPANAVLEDMMVANKDNKKYLENKVVNVKVGKGQFVYQSQLSKEENIDPFETMDLKKYRKVSLPITYTEGFGGDVKRGDKVDLIFTGQGKKSEAGSNTEENFQYSKAFLQDVLVYNVTTDTGYRFDDHSKKREGEVEEGGEEIQTSGSADELAVVTLAVTLDQAEEIATRKNIGTITFASRFDDNQSYETLGFVVGNYEKIYSAPANAETGRTTINRGQ